MNLASGIMGVVAVLVAVIVLTGPAAADGFEPDVSLASGVRAGRMDWNISADDGSPNIQSELTWEDLSIYQVRASAWKPVNRNFYLRGMFNYGWVVDGHNQDSDFLGNDRTGEYSRTNNKAEAGNVWDASAGGGFMVYDKAVKAAVVLGYSYSMQNLSITDGNQTICTAPCTGGTGPFAGLDSSYDATWYGPWVGLDLLYRTQDKRFTLFGTAEYHIAHYEAKANWNLRSDYQHPVSFEHAGRGYGVLASAGVDFALDAQWSVNADFGLEKWGLFDGTDITYNSDGTVSSTQLNEVDWVSAALMMGVKYRY